MQETALKCNENAPFCNENTLFCSENMHNLPDIAQNLIDVLGFETARLVIEQLGGASWRISYADNSNERKAIEARIGYQAWLALQNHFAGETLYIPKCHKALLAMRNQAIKTTLQSCADSLTPRAEKIRELVKNFRLSDRRIAQIAGEHAHAHDNRQAKLFAQTA